MAQVHMQQHRLLSAVCSPQPSLLPRSRSQQCRAQQQTVTCQLAELQQNWSDVQPYLHHSQSHNQQEERQQPEQQQSCPQHNHHHQQQQQRPRQQQPRRVRVGRVADELRAPLSRQQQEQQQPDPHKPYSHIDEQLLQFQQLVHQQHGPTQPQPPLQSGPPRHASSSLGRYPHTKRDSFAAALHITPRQAHQLLAAMPALSNYNPSTLAAKLQEISSMLDLQPQQLGPALCAAPRVLGWSLLKVERHLESLLWIQPDRALLAQMVLEAPLLLTWSSHHLQSRLTKMARQLGLSLASLILLLQQHPQLLPASGQLQPTLELLQQLYIMAAASEQAGFGTGVVADLVAAGQHRAARHAKRAAAPQQGHKNVAAAAQAAARDLALQHPQLLLVGPEGLQAQVAAMQARSGLPAAQVAAMLISQPELLLHSSGPSRPPASSAAGVQ